MNRRIVQGKCKVSIELSEFVKMRKNSESIDRLSLVVCPMNSVETETVMCTNPKFIEPFGLAQTQNIISRDGAMRGC